ncbi:MAG: hypothetical protein WKF34_10225 [Pyrinomonadaceae bacterium]
MESSNQLIRGLPDPQASRRFLERLADQHSGASARLLKKSGLLSDVLTLVSFSPLLATTILQNPEYILWLDKRRGDSGVRSTEELRESLAQFSLTDSTSRPQEIFARFRRRELLRIYLRDIRRLATIAEVTEEISNLADAILEAALANARVEADNRYGQPQEMDEKFRSRPARFCVAALGKLGSRELNYASDIDLLFIYSAEGSTTGRGTRGSVTNREYFIKLGELVIKLTSGAYRVDLRLRPHGSLGALAMSVGETVRYFQTEARAWERQVLIRSRGAAGDTGLFKEFFHGVEDLVFSKDETVESALASVRRSKEKIDNEQASRSGFDVKLGRGGIREIEFLAQALQLAHGGRDPWLRAPHTLISLDRLADRGHLTDDELTSLASAYEFLRRTEHVLQMENGLQTHTVPNDSSKRSLLAARLTFATGGSFEAILKRSTTEVGRTYSRVFGLGDDASSVDLQQTFPPIMRRAAKSAAAADSEFAHLTSVSPHFAAMLAANPQLAADLPTTNDAFVEPDYQGLLTDAVSTTPDFGARLSAMRRTWSRQLLGIVVRDLNQTISITEAKRLQSNLAEVTTAIALQVVQEEMRSRTVQKPAREQGYNTQLEGAALADARSDAHALDIAILALGKLGGRGLDYDSDLDLVITYFDPKCDVAGLTAAEYYGRAVELFVTTLSSMTRDGNLYRVDLRLRPFGSKGMAAISIDAFLDYMKETAAIWELLAFVKLRHVGGPSDLGMNVESEARRIIHERAATIPVQELAAETRRVRLALERERSRIRRSGEVDIKYGPGGMLDVYFAMRYLQLAWDVRDGDEVPAGDSRSTSAMFDRLIRAAAGSRSNFTSPLQTLKSGYEFLSTLDHNLRLTIGRTTRVPNANQGVLTTIAGRMHLSSPADLLEQLTIHRLAIRDAFDGILD